MGLRQLPFRTFVCLALISSTEAAQPRFESPAAIRAIINTAVETGPGAQKLALRELRQLKGNSVPALLRVFTGRDMKAAEPSENSELPLFEIPPPPPWIQEVLLDALDAQDATKVSRVLARFAKKAELEERLLCLQVAERLRGKRAVDAWISLVDDISPIRMRSSFVSAPVERSLTAIVSEAPLAVRQIEERLDSIGAHLHPAVARAVSRSSTKDAMSVLASLFGETAELDLVVLREAGRIQSFRESNTPEIEVRFLTSALRHEDSRYRAEAVVALARLRCTFAIESMLASLDDLDPRASRAALWSLKHLSGNTWGPDATRWRAWWTAEQAWHAERLELASSELESTDPALRLAALDELGAHPVYATQIQVVLENYFASANEIEKQRIEAILELFVG